MCCFTGVVRWVAATKIFARPWPNGIQLLAYSMSMEASDELAMVLPLPVPAHSAEDAVWFIDLKGYPDFFRDMDAGFPISRSLSAGGAVVMGRAIPAPLLEVHQVGDFEASFVPTVGDFARLDPRFRLPDGVWNDLPEYASFGFAVFKLKPGRQNVHPMAFAFPRANTQQIFFPTVHIHDGVVHPSAEFDHALYFQLYDADASAREGWTASTSPAGSFLKMNKIGDFVDGSLRCYRRQITGTQQNADVWLAL